MAEIVRVLSVPYPRVWSRKREVPVGWVVWLLLFQYPILGSGHGNPASAPAPTRACSPFSTLSSGLVTETPTPVGVGGWELDPSFSTLSSGLVTETLDEGADRRRPESFQYPILGSGHGNPPFLCRTTAQVELSVPYPRVWSRKPRVVCGAAQGGREELSVPYPRVWSRKPFSTLSTARPPWTFSTLSSGLVTETRRQARARRDCQTHFQYPILGSGHGNRACRPVEARGETHLSVPYPRVWSRKPRQAWS